MKQIKNINIKAALTTLMLLIVAFLANAQKLSNTQKVSLRAPDDIKIDGKTDDWGNKFEAFNNATEIFYTIANDDKNLYLIVKATDPGVINFKILTGGLTLAIQIPGKNDISITYPIKNDHKDLSFPLITRKGDVPDTTVKTADSIMNIHNKILGQRIQYVAVKGIEGLDTISIYNGDGIKAAGRFDNKKAYTIELSVELKVLGLSASGTGNFKYHITLNGDRIQQNAILPPAISSTGNTERALRLTAGLTAQIHAMAAPTDFWGEYALAKK